MLGRLCTASPQFINMREGSWFGSSAFIERITAMSSIHSPIFGNKSLTSIPLWPYFLNLKGEGNAAPVFRSVLMYSPGRGLPEYFSSNGFGSKLSTCDGPPFRKKWTTRFALPGKGGFLDESGFTVPAACAAGASNLASPNKPARLTAPMPIPQRVKKFRRVSNRSWKLG